MLGGPHRSLDVRVGLAALPLQGWGIVVEKMIAALKPTSRAGKYLDRRKCSAGDPCRATLPKGVTTPGSD
jgi:hypothetical protein